MLTVTAYAAKYGIPLHTVYSGLYRGRIRGERTASGWQVEDAPPLPRGAKSGSVSLAELSDYELALLWLNATITDEANVVLRSKDGFVPAYFADRMGAALWQRESGSFVCKLSSVSLVRGLRELGFTGRMDAGLPAPVVEDAALAAAAVETRSSFVRQLRYDRRYPKDRRHAYYVPALALCASWPLLTAIAGALSRLAVIPPRRLSPAANGTSATLKITSHRQLDALRNTLSAVGQNAVYWEDLDRHIATARQPYFADKRRQSYE